MKYTIDNSSEFSKSEIFLDYAIRMRYIKSRKIPLLIGMCCLNKRIENLSLIR